MIVKVCGMREAANINALSQLEIDFMGFIFYPKSPRYVSSTPDFIPQGISRVGVFVNEAISVILEKKKHFSLDYIQLHGNETPEFCEQLATQHVKIIKAFGIASASDFDNCAPFEPYCDYFLFDTASQQYGGSGISFNWQVVETYTGTTPFLLSGGIGANDVPKIKAIDHPRFAGIDLNSRFEETPGVKKIALIDQFIKELKK